MMQNQGPYIEMNMFQYIFLFVLHMYLDYLQDFMHETKSYYLKTIYCVSFHIYNQINVDYIQKEELPSWAPRLKRYKFWLKNI